MAGLTKIARVGKLLALLSLFALGLAACVYLTEQTTEAQYIGTAGQASTVSSWHTAGTSTAIIIPSCTASVTSNCIKMIGQVAHQLTVNYSGTTQCTVLMEGSLDGTNYDTLAAVTVFAQGGAYTTQETVSANSYYPLIRLRVDPGSGTTCPSLTGSYTGFQTPLPLSNLSMNFNSAAVASPVNLAGSTALTPYLVKGFQCYNTGSSAAFLELFDASITPTLGSGKWFYEAPIPGQTTFTYPGPDLFGYFIFWAAAVTAQNGNTAVTDKLECNFQMNYWGPFNPLVPIYP